LGRRALGDNVAQRDRKDPTVVRLAVRFAVGLVVVAVAVVIGVAVLEGTLAEEEPTDMVPG
jgi:hypothetical protein